MAVFYVERNLFQNPGADWKSNKGPTINDPPSDFFEAAATPETNTMMVTNGSTPAWGGALVSRKRGVPASNGKKLNWLAYRFQFRFDAKTGSNVARHETDLKICIKTRPNSQTKIRNVCNFSVQWNPDAAGGQYQIDLDPPGWVNTGFVVEEITPDVWHTQEFRFTFDDAANTFSVLSIQLDDQLFTIPANLQNVPMQLTNWEEVSSEQMQNEVYAAKSTTLIEYRDGVLCWSDERITMIPPVPARERELSFWIPRLDDGSQVLLGGDFDPFGEGAEAEVRPTNR
jgi:hypothetical protein